MSWVESKIKGSGLPWPCSWWIAEEEEEDAEGRERDVGVVRAVRGKTEEGKGPGVPFTKMPSPFYFVLSSSINSTANLVRNPNSKPKSII